MKRRHLALFMAASLTVSQLAGTASIALAEEAVIEVPLESQEQDLAEPDGEAVSEPEVAGEELDQADAASEEEAVEELYEETQDIQDSTDIPDETEEATEETDSDEIIEEEAGEILDLNLTEEITVEDVAELAEGENEDNENLLAFVDLRGEDNTWVYTNENLKLGVDTSRLDETDSRYTLEWHIGIQPLGVDWTWENAFEEGEDSEYSVSEDGKSITLYGAKLWAKYESMKDNEFIAVWVEARDDDENPIEYADIGIGIDVREPVYEYDLPECDPQLPGWNFGIDKYFEYNVEDSDHPYRDRLSTEITEVTVSVEDGESNAVTVEESGDGNGWTLYMNSYGHAVVTVTYIPNENDTNNQGTHTFDVWVGQNNWGINLDSDTGTDQMLPGASLDLLVQVWHHCYTEDEGYFEGDTNVELEWFYNEEAYGDVISISPDTEDANVCTVEAKADAEPGRDAWIGVRAYLVDEDGNREIDEESGEEIQVTESSFWIYIQDSYYVIEPIALDNAEIDPGTSIEINPVLKQISMQKEGDVETEVMENVQYRWEWDPDAVEITDAEEIILGQEQEDGSDSCGKAPFNIKKLRNWDTDIRVIAELPDEDGNYQEVERRRWNLPPIDYHTEFNGIERYDENGNTWMYTDEDYPLVLNTENLEGRQVSVEWQVGSWDENGEFIEKMPSPEESSTYYTVSEDGYSITLHGENIRTWITDNFSENDTWFDVRAVVKALNEEEMEEARISIDLRTPVYKYEFEHEDKVYRLPDEGIWINGTVNYHEDSKDQPYGYDEEVEVTNVSVKVEEGYPQKAVTMEKIENDDGNWGWSLYPHSGCEATVTVTYQTIDGEEDSYSFRYIIGEERYELHLTSDPECKQLLPGESLTLSAAVSYEKVGEEPIEDVKAASIEWQIEEGEEFVSLQDDKENDRSIVVIANSAGDTKIVVSASVDSDNDEEPGWTGEEEIWINVNDFQIKEFEDSEHGFEAVAQDQFLLPGESVTIYPVLMQSVSGEGEEKNTQSPYSDTVYYRWEYDDNMLEITPEEEEISEPGTYDEESEAYTGPAYTVTKCEEGWTRATLVAEIEDEDGKHEVCRREWYFNDVNCDVWFEDLRGGDYTWIFNDEENYQLGIGLPEELLSNDRELRVSVGMFTDESDTALTKMNEITPQGNKIVLNGADIEDWYNENKELSEDAYLAIQAEVVAQQMNEDGELGSIVVASCRSGLDVREPYSEWEDEGVDELLVGDELYYDNGEISRYVENADKPLGNSVVYSLTDIKSSNEEVLKPEQDEDTGKWTISAEAKGTATLTYTAQDGTGKIEKFENKIDVVESIYRVNVASSNNTVNMLHGETQRLLVNIFKVEADSNAKDGQKTTQLIPETDYTLEFSSDNPELIQVTKDGYITATDDTDAYGETWIEVKASILQEDGEPEIISGCVFYVSDHYYQIDVEDEYSVPWGGNVEITPGIISVGLGDDPFSGSVTFVAEEYGSEGLFDINQDEATNVFRIGVAEGAEGSDGESVSGVIKITAFGTNDYGYELYEEYWCYVAICTHTTDGSWMTRVWPGCEAEGEKVQICTKCNSISDSEEIEALGHNWGEWEITQEETCVADGSKFHICNRCDEVEDEVIPDKGHTWGGWTVTKAATCTTAGTQVRKCTVCNVAVESKTIAATGHKWSAWQTVSEATIFAPATQKRTCSVCGTPQTQTVGTKLAAFANLTASSLKMKVKQSTTKFKVTEMAKGDSLVSVTSSNTKVLKVSNVNAAGTFKLKAQKKTGKATLTIKLASGLTKTVKVTVQKGTVKTTKISGLTKTLTLQKKQKATLAPVITPVTSQQKVTYKTSNKKVATVSSKGVITAKKAGKAKITVKSGSKKYVVTVTVK